MATRKDRPMIDAYEVAIEKAHKMGDDALNPAMIVGDQYYAAKFLAMYGDRLRYDWRYKDKLAWVQWYVKRNTWKRRHTPPFKLASNALRMLSLEMGVKKSSLDTMSRIHSIHQFAREARLNSEWDMDPYLLGIPGGECIDIRDGSVRKQRPEDMITMSCSVKPAGSYKRWTKILRQLSCGDESWIDTIGAVAADCMIGKLMDHKLIVAYGKPGSGKGTVFNAIKKVLGGYAKATPAENWLTENAMAHPTWKAELSEGRMYLSSECPKKSTWNAPVVTSFTGGDTIRARFMYGDEFEYDPFGRLIILTNDLPEIPSVNSGIRRRVVVIPFDKVYGRAGDAKVEAFFKSEDGLAQVFGWMMDHSVEVNAPGRDINQRYPKCERVEDATQSYANEQDLFTKWIKANIKPSKKGTFSTNDAFSEFCKSHPMELTKRQFGVAMKRAMGSKYATEVIDRSGSRARGYRWHKLGGKVRL